MNLGSRPVWLLIGLCLCLAHAAPAEARKVSLTYVGYLAGQPVLDLKATIEAPKGAVPQDGEYAITADIVTTGNFAKLYRFHQNMRSKGALRNGLPSPSMHRVRQVIWDRPYTINLSYGEDGTVAIEADPPTLQTEQAEKDGYANNTLDPASAVVALSALYAGRKNCAAKIAVFDGTRRFDLDLDQGGATEVKPLENSYFSGIAAECRVTPSLKGGFKMNALAAGLYPQSATLWMAPAIPDFPSIPVRIATRNAFGEMTLDLISAKIR